MFVVVFVFVCVCVVCAAAAAEPTKTHRKPTKQKQLKDRPLKLRIHSSSVLARVRPQLVVFARCAQSDEGWYEMQGVSVVQQRWLLEAAPHVFQERGGGGA